MRPIHTLTKDIVAGLRGFLFDLDDTLLDHGKLLPEALGALYRLRDAGFELYAVTGRPAAWGAVVVHQWPIAGAIAENGAVALVRDAAGRVTIDDPLKADERQQRRAALDAIVRELRREHGELEPTDDVWQRISDYTFDIGEHRRLSPEVVLRASNAARALGATTLVSSVHLHVSLDRADKATGTLRVLGARHGLDPVTILSSYAFIGDSENDGACFAAFKTTLGVKNLAGRPTLLPRFQTTKERAEGFVEAAELLLARRAELW